MCLFTSCFIIQEGYQGILFRCGNIVQDKNNKIVIYAPGIYFRLPFIEHIKTFDTRIQTTNYLKYEYFTEKQNFFIVKYYIKWKISDCHQYYLTTHSNNVHALKNILNNQLNTAYNIDSIRLKIKDIIVHSQNIFFKNHHIIQKFKKSGIEIIDIGIKNIKLSHDVTKYIYNTLHKNDKIIIVNKFLQGQKEFKKNIFITNDNIMQIFFKKHQQYFIDQYKKNVKIFFCTLKNYKNIFKLNII